MLAPLVAHAEQITVTQNGLPNGYEDVTLNTPGYGSGTTEVGYTGQQELTVTAVNGVALPAASQYNLFVWCVDFGDDIYIGSTGNLFTIDQFSAPPTGVVSNPPVTFTQPMLDKLDWLANYGNTVLAGGPNADVSAAVQIAMWQTEYGFSYASGGDPNLATEITTIENLYSTEPGSYPISGTPVVLLSSNGTQELSTEIPEPVSLSLFGAGLLVLGMIRRRKA